MTARLLHSMMPLQVPVASTSAATNAAIAPLEADVLQHGLLLAHLREQQVREGAL